MSDNITANTEKKAKKEEKKHSMLSPSSSKIWLTCTPSALMMSLMPDEETAFTQEGTAAHALAEYKVRRNLIYDESAIDPRNEYKDFIDKEMEECTDEYLAFAKNTVSELEKNGYIPDIFTEIPLDLSSFVPEGMGTADLVIIAGKAIHIIDFKYGAFRFVESERNTQMMIYALGAAEAFKDAYGSFESVKMTIFQPRLSNISTYRMNMDELEAWKGNTLMPAAEKAFRGEGELVSGAHCEFCKARTVCRLQAKKKMNALEALAKMKEIPNAIKDKLLSAEEIGEAMDLGKGLTTWLENLQKLALAEALDGMKIPGYKLVEKSSPSIIPASAASAIEALGINPYIQKMITKTELKKLLGAKTYKAEIEPLLEEGDIKPALVPDKL